MAYTTQNPQFGFSLFSNLFTYDNTNPFLLDLDRNWTQVWKVMNILNAGKSIGFNDNAGIYRRPILKRQAVLAQIASATQSGANLILTFTDPNYAGFRQKDYVKDDLMFEGRVISDNNIGGVTIEPLYNPSGALVSGTNFAVGQTIRAYGDVSGNFNSGAKKPLYREISVQTDYSTVFREGTQRARREKFKTHIGTDGIAYFYTNDEVEMVKRAFKLYGKTIMFGEGGTKTSTVEGQINGTRGVRASIIADGVYDNSPVPLTQATFESLFFSVANVDGAVEQTIEVWCGRRALATIQRFYTNLVQYAGTQSTLGGLGKAGSGENWNVYSIGGVTVHLRVMGCLNDYLEVPDWMQDSVYIMDVTPQPATNENGQIIKQSPLQMIHWASNTDSENSMLYSCVPGTVAPGNVDNRAAVTGEYLIAANSNDGYSTDFVWDFGLSYVADKAALFEYIH
jgi:hypothetical protein